MPLTQLFFGDWQLEVDKEATEWAYHNAPSLLANCTCLHCRNYYLYSQSLPTEIAGFFTRFGIDPTKDGDILVSTEKDKHTLVYTGLYTLVGTIVRQPETTTPIAYNDTLQFAFTTTGPAPSIIFPQPIVFLDILLAVPWILEKPKLAD